MGSMREVESGNIHAGPEKLLDHGDGAGSRTKSANDLCFGPPVFSGERLIVHLHSLVFS